MRWWLCILALFLLPLAHAASGWYYSGDTFKLDNVVYSVEGFTHDKVLLGVGGTSYVIGLGECKETTFTEYCFDDSGYPDDEAHIKYSGGKQYYGYYISVNTIVPKLTVSRTVSTSKPGLDEEAEIEVTLKNTGDQRVEDILYTEDLPSGWYPSGTDIFPGLAKHRIVYLSPGDSILYRYALQPLGYYNATLTPNITYSYGGKSYSTTATPIRLSVTTPLEVTAAVTSTLDIDQVGTYNLTLKNTDERDEMQVKLAIGVPQGLHVIKTEGLKEEGGVYTADVTLLQDEEAEYSISFTGSVSDKKAIGANFSVTQGTITFTQREQREITVKADKLVPTLNLSSSRAAYKPGDRLLIYAVLENKNTAATFKSISATFSAPGLFNETPIRHEQFPPRRTITEAEQAIVFPPVSEPKTFTITFSGNYATPGGEAFAFSTSKSVTVAPVKQFLAIQRTIEPSHPQPGQNVTVTVAATNAFNQYLTYSTTESFDAPLRKASGIIFSEGSLERDASKQLYIYQLEIPAEYNGSDLNITTTVNVKGEEPQRVTSTLKVTPKTPVVVKNETKETTPQPVAVVPEPKKEKKGFFAEVWDFLKGLL